MWIALHTMQGPIAPIAAHPHPITSTQLQLSTWIAVQDIKADWAYQAASCSALGRFSVDEPGHEAAEWAVPFLSCDFVPSADNGQWGAPPPDFESPLGSMDPASMCVLEEAVQQEAEVWHGSTTAKLVKCPSSGRPSLSAGEEPAPRPMARLFAMVEKRKQQAAAQAQGKPQAGVQSLMRVSASMSAERLLVGWPGEAGHKSAP